VVEVYVGDEELRDALRRDSKIPERCQEGVKGGSWAGLDQRSFTAVLNEIGGDNARESLELQIDEMKALAEFGYRHDILLAGRSLAGFVSSG
jgi:hypothetical protein